jgi:hypothetical protein
LTKLKNIKTILMEIGRAYLESVIKRFSEYKSLGDKTFAQLSENDFFFQPNEASNSIAVIIQHMHGNMLSRWTNFLSEDGEKDWRQRDEEFEEQELSREQLILKWEEGWKLVLNTLGSLTAEDLLKQVTIRQQPLTVVDAINRQLAHYSTHVGQIVYIGKWIRGNQWTSLSIPKKTPVH